MQFETFGSKDAPAVLFFHAMGVTGASSEPVARYLQEKYFCILPTSTVYCEGQKYAGKADEIRQVEMFLTSQGVTRLALVVASSIGAGKALTYGNMRRQMADSLEDRPFPPLTRKMQEHCFFEFGSGEEHFKYREAVRKAYPDGHFPVFEDHNHMQYQIRDPQGFAAMLERIIEQNELPPLPFLRK